MPGDPDVVIRALFAELCRAHQLERLAPEHAFAARRGTVAEMESRVGQQVRDADTDASRCDAGGGNERPLKGRRAPATVEMADGEAVRDEVGGRRAGMRETERLEDEVAN